MGTFHHGKGDLHGITIFVDTPGDAAYIGRCDTFTEAGVILLDGDAYAPREDGPTKSEWLAKAARVGVWKTFDRVLVPRSEIASVQRLADLA